MEILQIIATGLMMVLLGRYIRSEHKKTRKETQEIKTRLSWIKKRQKKSEEDPLTLY